MERENPYIQGTDRNQSVMFPEVVDDYVCDNNAVRVIDSYVDKLDLSELGFAHALPKHTGRPSYAPSDMLKLYIYGYLKKTRSSRQLAQLTQLNVEVFWLLKKLQPDFRTISDFRKDNIEGLKKVCKEFTLLCKTLKLFARELIAIDGSKFSAVNHNSKTVSKKDISKMLEQVDKNIEEHFSELEKQDRLEESLEELSTNELEESISKLQKHRENLIKLQASLEESEETQISITDPDCRKMRTGNQGIDMCYNVQLAVDSKHKLIVSHDIRSEGNDFNQLYSMAAQAKQTLGVEELKVTADKGYYKEEQIAECEKNKIKCYIPEPNRSENEKKGLFTYKDFIYDQSNDFYLCPGKEKLTLSFTGEKHGRETGIYTTKACKGCKLRSHCTTSKTGRRINRSVYIPEIEVMKKRMKEDPSIAAQRKSLVEHPFGTLKQAMGHGYFLLKGKTKVAAEFSMSVLVYNMKRVINIVGVKPLLEMIQVNM